MLKFVFGLIILLAVIVGVIVHVREKKSLSEVLVWIISALTLGADIFGLIVPGANEVFIQSGRDINVAEEQRIINVEQDGSNVLNQVEKIDNSPMSGSTFTAQSMIVNMYGGLKEQDERKPTETERTSVSLEVRNLEHQGESKLWYPADVANEGDRLRFKVGYRNLSGNRQMDIIVFIKWSEFLEYIPDSTMLYDSNHPEGIHLKSNGLQDDTGINIGNSKAGASAVVTFEAVVKSGLPSGGTNVLRNYAQIYVNDLYPELGKDFAQGYCDVLVNK